MAVNNMSAQKTITSIEKKQHILVCLSASPSNEKIVQTAAKMAKVLDARFTAFRRLPLFVTRQRLPQNTASP